MAGGGAAMYVSKQVHAFHRTDLKSNADKVESCWIEILQEHDKPSIIVGCIYGHPSANLDNYTIELHKLIQHLYNSKNQIFIPGDINIDFLNVNSHSKTEDTLICYTAATPIYHKTHQNY